MISIEYVYTTPEAPWWVEYYETPETLWWVEVEVL